jgi:hypothetical protein
MNRRPLPLGILRGRQRAVDHAVGRPVDFLAAPLTGLATPEISLPRSLKLSQAAGGAPC